MVGDMAVSGLNADSMMDKYAHLCNPLKELADSWEIDISEELSDYVTTLNELSLCFDFEASSLPESERTQKKINFTQAAMIIQGSTSVYVKKVEFLHRLALKTLSTLGTTDDLRGGENGKSRRNKPYKNKAMKEQEAFEEHCEEFLLLDDVLPLQAPLSASNRDSETMPQNRHKWNGMAGHLKEPFPSEFQVYGSGTGGWGFGGTENGGFMLLNSTVHISGALQYEPSKMLKNRLNHIYKQRLSQAGRNSISAGAGSRHRLSQLLETTEGSQNRQLMSMTCNSLLPSDTELRNTFRSSIWEPDSIELLRKSAGTEYNPENALQVFGSSKGNRIDSLSPEIGMEADDDSFMGPEDDDDATFAEVGSLDDELSLEDVVGRNLASQELYSRKFLSCEGTTFSNATSGASSFIRANVSLDPTIWRTLNKYTEENQDDSPDATNEEATRQQRRLNACQRRPLVQNKALFRKRSLPWKQPAVCTTSKSAATKLTEGCIKTLRNNGKQYMTCPKLQSRMQRLIKSKRFLLLSHSFQEFLDDKLKVDKKLIRLAKSKTVSHIPEIQINKVNTMIDPDGEESDYGNDDDGFSVSDYGEEGPTNEHKRLGANQMSQEDAERDILDSKSFNFDLHNPIMKNGQRQTLDFARDTDSSHIGPDDEDQSPLTYVELVKRHVDQFIKRATKWAKQSNIGQMVGDWQDKLGPLLDEEEKHPEFDIHQYGAKIVGALPVSSKTMSFDSVLERLNQYDTSIDGCDVDDSSTFLFSQRTNPPIEKYEICRLALATLQLANNGNVQLSHTANDTDLKVSLLDSVLATKKLSMNNSPSAEPLQAVSSQHSTQRQTRKKRKVTQKVRMSSMRIEAPAFDGEIDKENIPVGL